MPVGERRKKVAKQMQKLTKQGVNIQPVEIAGRKIAKSFWGAGWCDHIESFSDYANRIPRGRTYVRNGSVCHLKISRGQVEAIVSGSSLYRVNVKIASLGKAKWESLKKKCTGKVSSVIELLQGKFSDGVMELVTDKNAGLFPGSSEISFSCDCPDHASMCKHIASALYGIGARLDDEPDLLFKLRGVDHNELITADMDVLSKGMPGKGKGSKRRIADASLADVFGVEMSGTEVESITPKRPKKKSPKKKTAAKKVAVKKIREKKYFSAAMVKALRKKLSLTSQEFAKTLGVSFQTVSNWESAGSNGKLNLQARSLAALNQANAAAKTK